ncbi:PadR family transcriptional regulator [Homoserinimonas sp. OAct 916]|uniref:PadR family transcriptional regulator n=1 Tax=Homoserinimonas sp. OAct 916 TaxID=2211450 RepID=UPI000DBE7BD1|nr:PadR family transcriptional regulator [Homoserinimonas sp. OAct 916]
MRADVGAQLRKGVVEYCVLGLLAREPMYGWQLSETLVTRGLIASIGTLYPMLTRLRTQGLVSSFDEESDAGPVRKYYRLTDAGIRELAEFRLQWAPFSRTVDELIEEEHRVEEHHAKERNVEEDHHA